MEEERCTYILRQKFSADFGIRFNATEEEAKKVLYLYVKKIIDKIIKTGGTKTQIEEISIDDLQEINDGFGFYYSFYWKDSKSPTDLMYIVQKEQRELSLEELCERYFDDSTIIDTMNDTQVKKKIKK